MSQQRPDHPPGSPGTRRQVAQGSSTLRKVNPSNPQHHTTLKGLDNGGRFDSNF